MRLEVESLLAQDSETGTMLKTLISKVAGSVSLLRRSYRKKDRSISNIPELIGEGGMAQVYKAVRDDDQYQKVVAIKILRLDSSCLHF